MTHKNTTGVMVVAYTLSVTLLNTISDLAQKSKQLYQRKE